MVSHLEFRADPRLAHDQAGTRVDGGGRCRRQRRQTHSQRARGTPDRIHQTPRRFEANGDRRPSADQQQRGVDLRERPQLSQCRTRRNLRSHLHGAAADPVARTFPGRAGTPAYRQNSSESRPDHHGSGHRRNRETDRQSQRLDQIRQQRALGRHRCDGCVSAGGLRARTGPNCRGGEGARSSARRGATRSAQYARRLSNAARRNATRPRSRRTRQADPQGDDFFSTMAWSHPVLRVRERAAAHGRARTVGMEGARP